MPSPSKTILQYLRATSGHSHAGLRPDQMHIPLSPDDPLCPNVICFQCDLSVLPSFDHHGILCGVALRRNIRSGAIQCPPGMRESDLTRMSVATVACDPRRLCAGIEGVSRRGDGILVLDLKGMLRDGYAGYVVMNSSPVPVIEIYGAATAPRLLHGLTVIPPQYFIGVYDFAMRDVLVHFGSFGPEQWYGTNYDLLPISCTREMSKPRFDPRGTMSVDEFWMLNILKEAFRMRGDGRWLARQKADRETTWVQFFDRQVTLLSEIDKRVDPRTGRGGIPTVTISPPVDCGTIFGAAVRSVVVQGRHAGERREA